ncbi:uncharacterized protein LOC135163584 [Diachasmimorpha longicaudata]|uniref:uncharacterized protein LOC135163584 n=1 Tax=Diachasmimorpha longicaudata TaxID=58733 RepID=UPI0030B8B7A6
MSELTIEVSLLEKIIRKFTEEATARVTAVNYKNVGEKGDNYTSEVKRIFINYITQGNAGDLEKEVSLFLKHMHNQNEQAKILLQGVFEHETKIMMGPLEDMSPMLTVARVPRLLYSHQDDPTFAIMEDLGPLGFIMHSRATGLDLAHALLAMRGLAEFHGSSVLVYEKTPDYKKTLSLNMFENPNNGAFNFFNTSFHSLADTIAEWEELGPKYAEKLRNLTTGILEKMEKVYKSRENEFTVLNHGDCTQLNLLFAYDENKKPIKIALVDFQIATYNNPVVDLRSLISSSTTQEVFQHHQHTLLREYHSVLSETMKTLHCKTPTPSLEDIEKMYDDRAFISVLSTCASYPIIHAAPSNVVSLDDMLFDNTNRRRGQYEQKDFKDLLITRLLDFDKSGLLDQ